MLIARVWDSFTIEDFWVFGTRSSAGLSVLWQFMKFIYLCVVISHSLGEERGGEDREV